ncbi:hypothetical protein CHU95_02290 [Niveispirillum lacus]|uniref:Replication initiation factor domain-containing protein n=1 Tax=Niveispirillum lacus TaxID=1981099 RepID=A0A255Z6C5_9PROT|nr:hypothetical protein [Niveispirillum lacus]OYQ37028.1 hypothetical protein CHU95_02290 [Niveispirillum lacus]
MSLKPFYWNFDGLDVTFQGRIPQAMVDRLEEAKADAIATKAAVLLEWQDEPMHVAESGAKGGYAFRCDTGPVGMTWFFSRNQKPDNWGIRVSTKSNALASMGLGGVRAEMHRFLSAIGADVLKASISRVDYCLDFVASDIEATTGEAFILNPTAFVMHSHTSRADHDDDGGMSMHGVSGRYTSVTCGKMPGRQIILYEKSREVRQKQKREWWAHWNAARNRQSLPALSGDETIWRLELRAGKAHLKDRWGIRTWADLDTKLGDLYARALADIRYTIPNLSDSERCRWLDHPLWEAVRHIVTTDLFEMTTGAEPNVVKAVKREQVMQTVAAHIQGMTATYSIAADLEPDDADSIAAEVASMVHTHIRTNRNRFEASRERAAKRYRFIENPQADPVSPSVA